MEPEITIKLSEYNDLQNDSLKLLCLEGAGVDNWGGYDQAMEEYAAAVKDNSEEA